LDEDCTIYTKLASFDSIIAAEEANYSIDVTGYAINSLKTAFYQPLTCESQEFANVSILFLEIYHPSHHQTKLTLTVSFALFCA